MNRPNDPLDARFWAFHHAHPEVYRLLVDLARQWRQHGHRHVGIKMLWERVRYEHRLALPDRPWKLNNDYPSRYARLIMAQEPGSSNARAIIGVPSYPSLK